MFLPVLAKGSLNGCVCADRCVCVKPVTGKSVAHMFWGICLCCSAGGTSMTSYRAKKAKNHNYDHQQFCSLHSMTTHNTFLK